MRWVSKTLLDTDRRSKIQHPNEVRRVIRSDEGPKSNKSNKSNNPQDAIDEKNPKAGRCRRFEERRAGQRGGPGFMETPLLRQPESAEIVAGVKALHPIRSL